MRMEWIRCPICNGKTRLQIREDTELKNFLHITTDGKNKLAYLERSRGNDFTQVWR